MKTAGSKAEDLVREAALAFPEAYEERPWGEVAIKVRKKVFVFMGTSEGRFGLSVKLPHSHPEALLLPFVEPTGYGLGKSGWVSARFQQGDAPPMPMIRAWLEESYRAVAPKKLAALLDVPAEPPATPKRPRKTASK
ncbi:MmcQ/YjbR family DNA-binding protein [Vulgatibacter sp.]|uniref:MmcQ/YjbR family DNA-binding protein n=1 Tax=Vulgatibacter sp. TaxID=1971226 RepID=UPI0035675CC5